jgi:hypothetical protein
MYLQFTHVNIYKDIYVYECRYMNTYINVNVCLCSCVYVYIYVYLHFYTI